MIFFLFTNFILFIKLFLFILLRLILIENVFSMLLMILLLCTALFILYYYPRIRFKKLSKLREFRLNLIKKYHISNFGEELYNIILILIYFFGITSLIFYFRLLNKEKIIDLKYYYFIIHKILVKNDILNTFCTILIYTLLLTLYLLLMMRIIKYFKFQVIKRHLYFMNSEANYWYQSTLFFGFIYKIVIVGPFSLESRFYKLIELAYQFIFNFKKDYGPNYETLSHKEQTEICLKYPVDPEYILIKYCFIYKIVPFILKHIHHLLLMIFIIYDLIYNNFMLTKIFYVLPWIFCYDLYVRVSIFVDDLCYNKGFIYFYKSLWLLIFPLLINYTAYSIKTFANTNLESLDNILDLRVIHTSEFTKESQISDFVPISVFDWHSLILTPEGEEYICHNNLSAKILTEFGENTHSIAYSLNYAVDLMKTLFHINNTMVLYEEHKANTENIFNILKYLIFFIGWTIICY